MLLKLTPERSWAHSKRMVNNSQEEPRLGAWAIAEIRNQDFLNPFNAYSNNDSMYYVLLCQGLWPFESSYSFGLILTIFEANIFCVKTPGLFHVMFQKVGCVQNEYASLPR